MNNKENNRIAVISGGAGYLGSAIARALAKQGMSIALLYHTTTEEKVQDIIASLPGTSHRAYKCDIHNEQEVATTIESIEKDMGKIFACVHTAGTKPIRKTLIATSSKELEDALHTHTLGAFALLSLCAKKLKEHKHGVIVGVTTVGVVIPEATHSLGGYIPAKYALQGMLTMFKEELKNSGVRVYSVAPGFMEGGMNSDIPKAFVEMIRTKSKTKQLTTAEDVAEKIAYLCSDTANNDNTLTHVVALEYQAE